jgi:hypothetical protein
LPGKKQLPLPPDQQSSIIGSLTGRKDLFGNAPMYPERQGPAPVLPALDTNFLSGMAKAGPYQTALEPVDEMRFQKWVSENGIPFQDSSTADYDMRGYWHALQRGDPRAFTAVNPADKLPHFPDTWKTPYHKTFSNESQYATPGAPRWVGDDSRGWMLIDKLGNILHDERRVK